MIDGMYKIRVDVPSGRKDGTVTLRTEGDAVAVEVDAPIVGKKSMQGQVEADSFIVRGSGKFKLVGQVDYTLRGTVAGDKLHIDIKSNKGEFQLDGIRA